jgi:integrase
MLPARNAPYWCPIANGRALGYRKGANGGSWLARYRANDGARHQTALGSADDALDAVDNDVLTFAAAQAAARDWFARIDGNLGKRLVRYTVGHALDDYVAAFAGKSREKTVWAIDRYIRPALGENEVVSLTANVLGSFLRDLADQPAVYRANKKGERKLRPVIGTGTGTRARRASANRVFAILKAALSLAFQNCRVPSDDAWRKVKPFPKVDAPRVQYLSPAEAVRLVNAAAVHFRPLVQAALLTGARWSELCRMRVRDADLVAGVVLIPETKAGRPRYVHLSDEGVGLFGALCGGKALDELIFTNQHGRAFGASHQIRPMREACENGKVPSTGFHILRHTYGSRLAMAGVPIAVIAEALGHSDERITRKHYAHLSPSYVRDAIRAGLGTMGVFEMSIVSPIRKAG